MHHKDDFNKKAEWHFSATSHGKSAYDGLGSIFKSEAYRVSLMAKAKDAILKAQFLFEWGQKKFKEIYISFFSKADHNKSMHKSD